MQDSNDFNVLKILFSKCIENKLIDIDFPNFLEKCIDKKLINKNVLQFLDSNQLNNFTSDSKKKTYKKTYQTNWLNHVRKVSIEKNISWKQALVVARDTYIK